MQNHVHLKGEYLFHKKLAFVLVFLSLSTAIVLFASSGITKDALLSPSLFTGTEKLSALNIPYILLALAAIPLAYATTSLYSIYEKSYVPELMLAPGLMAPLVMYLIGISTPSIIISIAIIISIFIAMHFSFSALELYKKINAPSIAKKVAGNALLFLNIAISFAVFYTLFLNPAYSNSQVDSMLKEMTGMSVSDIDNITQAAAEQQRQASYAWIENIETSVQIAISQNLDDMTSDQQTACQNAIDTRMQEIDSAAKREIDNRMGEQVLETPVDTEYIENMLSFLLNWYPLLMAITIFAILEFFRVFLLAPITWLYALILEQLLKDLNDKNNREEHKVPI